MRVSIWFKRAVTLAAAASLGAQAAPMPVVPTQLASVGATRGIASLASTAVHAPTPKPPTVVAAPVDLLTRGPSTLPSATPYSDMVMSTLSPPGPGIPEPPQELMVTLAPEQLETARGAAPTAASAPKNDINDRYRSFWKKRADVLFNPAVRSKPVNREPLTVMEPKAESMTDVSESSSTRYPSKPFVTRWPRMNFMGNGPRRGLWPEARP